MAKESIFLEEAYETLQRLSADDIKRLEYEAREKALRDHNSFVGSARRQGERIGEKRGEKNGIELAKKVFKLHTQGKTEKEIASECRMDVEKVREILEYISASVSGLLRMGNFCPADGAAVRRAVQITYFQDILPGKVPAHTSRQQLPSLHNDNAIPLPTPR